MNRYVEFQLDGYRKAFETSGNPYFVWEAILLCFTTTPVFPVWVVKYLFQCSKRMQSEKAGQASDLREILPWVFGFPKKRRGTGKLLNPHISTNKARLLTEFAWRILKGEDPVTARRNACNAAFDGKNANVDDKTLLRWLLNGLRLKKAPKGPKQWKEIVYQYSVVLIATERLSKMNMPRAKADEAFEELNEALEEFNRVRARPGGQLIDPAAALAIAVGDLKLRQTKFRESLT